MICRLLLFFIINLVFVIYLSGFQYPLLSQRLTADADPDTRFCLAALRSDVGDQPSAKCFPTGGRIARQIGQAAVFQTKQCASLHADADFPVIAGH